MADVTERIEKQMEGTNLALAAVAEVLQKMDARFSVDEESQIRKAEAKEAASERLTLVKEIASEVVGFLKADQGLDVDGLKTRSAAKVKGTGDDNEKPANVKSNIADQQATIQAMRKQDEEEEEEEEAPFPPKGGYMKNVEEDEEDDEDLDKEGSEEYPAEEEEPEEDELKSMAKELRKMKKQMRLQKATMEKTIQTEAESRLRKMGFREENSLQRPQILGVDGSTPIVKKESGETVDQLMNLSYKQLRDLQAQIEMGNTDGVPKELIGGN
jgi:hypothetical protein